MYDKVKFRIYKILQNNLSFYSMITIKQQHSFDIHKHLSLKSKEILPRIIKNHSISYDDDIYLT